MEPIKWAKSNTELNKKHKETPEYKSVYKCNLLHRRLGGSDKQFPKFSKITELKNEIPLKSTLYKCVDEYVEMTMPNSSACSTPRTTPVATTQPLPSPRKCMEYGDYANISIINAHNKHEYHHNIDTASLKSASFDSNYRKSTENKHSPTPEYPPPSASEAEYTIFEFVKPAEKPNLNRKSLLLQQQEPQFYDGLRTFIWEGQAEPQDEKFNSLTSSQASECVEEFVADKPFAGLFKGSSLNLANSSSLDLRSSTALDEVASGLRSPSLVRSVKPIAAERNVTIKTPTSDDVYEFDAAKAWDEINTIFERISNQVAVNDSTMQDINEEHVLTNTLRKNTLTIRKPAELLLRSNNQEQNSNPNWCHPADTLLYGYVLYNVFYLGSTVIRELHGTASTRKSIQKLKREETPAQQENEEYCLIKDINSSTRILKETNQQTRLEVGIAMSHAGVRFIDTENKSTICVHDIENINCVSQDTDDLRYFAYITREKDIHYCHVFMVDDVNFATEIILTLGQAFEVAYQLSLKSQEDGLQALEINNVNVDIIDNI